MRPFTLAILSDLHIGKEVRAKDLSPYGNQEYAVDASYQKSFLEFLTTKQIVADYLIIPGDITDAAHPKEMKLASDLILNISKGLGVPKERVLFVPGNHEVDWEVLKLGRNPVRRAQRYDPLKYREYLFKELMDQGNGDLLEAPYFAIWEFDDLLVAGYNSSWHDDPDGKFHYGNIDKNHIVEIEKNLKELKFSPETLRVFLIHHNPISYSSPIPGEPDLDQTVCAEEFLLMLNRQNFDFLIHGHTHQPGFTSYCLDTSTPIGILAAGSFSLELPQEWIGRINNQFHLVRIESRNQETKSVQGVMENWAYYIRHGWIPSDQARDGIAHFEPFGTYLSKDQLRERLSRLTKLLFEKQEWIDWVHLIHADRSLKYISPQKIVEALAELAPEHGFILQHSILEQLVLIKKEP